MACGYGACYGCVVERDGHYVRLCVDGPRPRGRGVIPLLNASGCLDALTAPEVARSLDAFVTKTVTPLPREGNPPPRIAETESGMLNSIGLQNPGIDRFLRGESAPSRRARSPDLGLRRRVLGRRLRGDVRATRRPGRRRDDRAQPLVPERRGGAGNGRRARGGCARGHDQAAVREALACDAGTSPSRARAVAHAGSRRPVARQHDPGARDRPRDGTAEARARGRRLLRARR